MKPKPEPLMIEMTFTAESPAIHRNQSAPDLTALTWVSAVAPEVVGGIGGRVAAVNAAGRFHTSSWKAVAAFHSLESLRFTCVSATTRPSSTHACSCARVAGP